MTQQRFWRLEKEIPEMSEYRQIDTLEISDQRKIISSVQEIAARTTFSSIRVKSHSTQDTTTRKRNSGNDKSNGRFNKISEQRKTIYRQFKK